MYYILNETNQIIAADDSLLNLCGVAHINELSSSIAKGDTTFDFESDVNVNLTVGRNQESYKISRTSLSSLLGTLTLASLSVEKAEEEITFGDYLTLDDDATMSLKEEVSEEVSEGAPVVEDDLLDESALFGLVPDEVKEEETTDTVETEEAPLALGLDNDLFLDTEKAEETAEEIHINIEEISQKIGISTDDYNGFLNAFIDTALGLEKDLQSNDEERHASAIGALSHLSDVLHLPVLGDIINKIDDTTDKKQRDVIESFYATLSRITTSSAALETLNEAKMDVDLGISIREETPVIEEEKLELFDELETLKEPMAQVEIKENKSLNSESFTTISLEGIKPKHFDFQLEEVANDLSLPVELIEEFVHNFIEQAHIETKKMLEAYEEGDLDTIQKIGHLLQGASSNLRINVLSDTLCEIQFCEDSSNLETLIKDYWAHFLSFENQINVISK